MIPFIGLFYAVTKYSVFKITVPDLVSSPVVMKMSTKVFSADLGRDLKVPVGGVFRKGFFLGLTACGIYKYDVTIAESQTIVRPPIPIEKVPGKIRSHRMTKSKSLVGLFLHRRDMEVCAESPNLGGLDPRWYFATREVITTIGSNHPLISISRTEKYALPDFLCNMSISLPTLAEVT